MSDEEKSAKGIVSALLSIANEDTKEYINVYLFILAPMFMMLALFGVFKFVASIGEEERDCWTIQVVNEKAIKLNTCTGETENLELSNNKSTTEESTKNKKVNLTKKQQ